MSNTAATNSNQPFCSVLTNVCGVSLSAALRVWPHYGPMMQKAVMIELFLLIAALCMCCFGHHKMQWPV